MNHHWIKTFQFPAAFQRVTSFDPHRPKCSKNGRIACVAKCRSMAQSPRRPTSSARMAPGGTDGYFFFGGGMQDTIRLWFFLNIAIVLNTRGFGK